MIRVLMPGSGGNVKRWLTAVVLAVIGVGPLFSAAAEWWHYVLAVFGSVLAIRGSYLYSVDNKTVPSKKNDALAFGLAPAITVAVLSSPAGSLLQDALSASVEARLRDSVPVVVAIAVFIAIHSLLDVILCFRSLMRLVDLDLGVIDTIVQRELAEAAEKKHPPMRDRG